MANKSDGPTRLTDASTIKGVLDLRLFEIQYQLSMPPTVLAKVKDGTLYMPAVVLARRYIPPESPEAHTNRHSNSSRHQWSPRLAGCRCPEYRCDGKYDTKAESPLPSQGWQALARNQPGCEDPYIARGNLEQITGDRIDAGYYQYVSGCMPATIIGGEL